MKTTRNPSMKTFVNMRTISILVSGTLLILLPITWWSCISKGATIESPEKRVNRLTVAVLSNFEDDHMKYAAGRFLLEDIKLHNHTCGDLIEVYEDSIIKYAGNLELQYKSLKALMEKKSFFVGINCSDGSYLTSDYLINHINNAVDNFRNYNWDKEVSFEDFCNYVLPYRIGKEYPSDWITYFHQQYLKDNDSSIFEASAETRIELLLQWLKKRKEGFSIKQLDLPELSVVTSDYLRAGTCHELTKVTVSALRAFGIPATVDFTPLYANRNGQHEWTIVLRGDKSRAVNIATAKIEMDVDTAQRRFSLVYRKSFRDFKDSHLNRFGYRSFLPDYFNDSHLSNVTGSYYKCFNIDVPAQSKSNNVYLAVFSVGNWVPVAWGEMQENNAHFKNVPPEVVYMPVAFVQDKMEPIGVPFVLTKEGRMEFLKADTLNSQRVHIRRKYPLFDKIQFFIDRMKGGVFEAANTPDFKVADILFTITKSPGDNYNIVKVQSDKKYRYIRYIGPPASACNVAEISFYEKTKDTTALQGNVIGTEGSWENIESRNMKAAFDGNPLTFFDYKDPNGGWTGLDLTESKTIKKIKFIARTDMNIIEPGHQYELFYWDDEWKTLGKKTTHTSVLIYGNVPNNALLWVRDLTTGTEERIFQYKDQKQVWR